VKADKKQGSRSRAEAGEEEEEMTAADEGHDEDEDEDDDDDEEEEEIQCVVCDSPRDAQHMLLCDGCDDGYHMACLHPPLEAIPEGDWFCEECLEIKELCCQVCSSPELNPTPQTLNPKPRTLKPKP
jgi:remodeling and spacing factor 1